MKRWLPIPIVLAVLIAIYLLMPGKRSAVDSSDAEQPLAEPTRVVKKLAAPIVEPEPELARAEPLDPSVVDALFPDLEKSVCPAPADLPGGRFRAGADVVLTRGGQTTVLSTSDAGSAPVFLLGRQVGELEWSNGACTWAPRTDVVLSGRVAGGGVHRIAGCPVGETVETNAEGAFEISVPEGQQCAARVVRTDGGLAMGKTLIFDGSGDLEIELQAPTGAGMTDEEITAAAAMLEKLDVKLLGEARAELERLKGLGGDLPGAEWLIDEAAQRVALFEGEVERLQDPESREEAVEEFLFSQAN